MAYSYPATAVRFTREAVLTQIRSGWVPATWMVIRADRSEIRHQIVSLVAALAVATLFVPLIAVYPSLVKLLNEDLQHTGEALPVPSAPETIFWIIYGELLLYGACQAVVVGRRSLAGGFNQTLIVTPEGIVADGGPSHVVAFADVETIKPRNWALPFSRRESLSWGYRALRVTYRNGTRDLWQIDDRFGRRKEVQTLIMWAFAQWQRAHELA